MSFLRFVFLFALILGFVHSGISQYDSTRNGKFRILDSNEQILFSGKYLDSQRHGIFKEYDSSGLLMTKSKYKRGKLRWMQLYRNGKVYAVIDKKGVLRKRKDCGC